MVLDNVNGINLSTSGRPSVNVLTNQKPCKYSMYAVTLENLSISSQKTFLMIFCN